MLNKDNYCLSKYNIYLNKQNHLYIYNSLSGNIVGMQKSWGDKLLYDNMKVSCSLFDRLCDTGVLVDSNINEEQIADEMAFKISKHNETLHLILFPTDECNFRCTYCYEDYKKNTMTIEIQNKIVSYVEKNLANFKVLEVSWFGGEPLLAIHIIASLTKRFKKICFEQKKIYISSITTNGYNLKPDVYKILRKCNITSYQITLDGLEETHNKQRFAVGGQGTWKQILTNLQYIRDNTKSGLQVYHIRINLTKDIYDHRIQLIDFLNSEFGADRRFGILWYLASDWGNMNNPETKSQFCTEDQLYECIKISCQVGLKNYHLLSCLKPNGVVCYAANSNYSIIGANGIFKKCTICLNESYNQLGDILKDDSPEYSENWDSNIRLSWKRCKDCITRPICHNLACLNVGKSDYCCTYLEDDILKLMDALTEDSENYIWVDDLHE